MTQSVLPVVSVLAVLALASCASVDEQLLEDILAADGDVTSGEALFEAHCQRCHGPAGDGDGDERGPAIADRGLTEEDIAHAMLVGPHGMPSFADQPVADLADLAAYVASLQ